MTSKNKNEDRKDPNEILGSYKRFVIDLCFFETTKTSFEEYIPFLNEIQNRLENKKRAYDENKVNDKASIEKKECPKPKTLSSDDLLKRFNEYLLALSPEDVQHFHKGINSSYQTLAKNYEEKSKEIDANVCPFKQFLGIDIDFEIEEIAEENEEEDISNEMISFIKERLDYIIHALCRGNESEDVRKIFSCRSLCEDFLENNVFYPLRIILQHLIDNLTQINCDGSLYRAISILRTRIAAYLEFLEHR